MSAMIASSLQPTAGWHTNICQVPGLAEQMMRGGKRSRRGSKMSKKSRKSRKSRRRRSRRTVKKVGGLVMDSSYFGADPLTLGYSRASTSPQ